MNDDAEVMAGYRLERMLGRGTMGSVYLANDSEGRRVAIKRVPSLGSDDDRSRLRREAQTMAALRHPNILAVIDVVDDGDGIAMVLPYAAHGTLAGRLAASGPIDATIVRSLIAPIADALDFAHRNGVLHRDVKPSNILFVEPDAALLADFGIARNAAHTNLTTTNLAIGTAGYLDPELADGAEPSPASDQYALGVVCYEALTGRVPYAGHAPLAVIRAADRGEHEPLDDERFGPLASVVERAMARDPALRFPSCAAFAEALRLGSDTSISPDATAAFRRRLTPKVLEAAAPVSTRSRRPWWTAGAAIAIMAAIAAPLAARRGSDRGPSTLRVRPLPTCDPQLAAQCVRSYSQTGSGLKVSFESGDTATYEIGERGDVLRVGNFFCGARATLAIYRPRTGVIYYLSGWPDTNGESLEVVADPSGIPDAQVGIGDKNSDDCADIALDRDRMRTWFLPSVQTDRLTKVSLTKDDVAPSDTGASG